MLLSNLGLCRGGEGVPLSSHLYGEWLGEHLQQGLGDSTSSYERVTDMLSRVGVTLGP